MSGAISSITRKTKTENADGSSHTYEENYTQAHGKGAGHGNLSAVAHADADAHERKYRGIEEGAQSAGRLEQADHLGIEGRK